MQPKLHLLCGVVAAALLVWGCDHARSKDQRGSSALPGTLVGIDRSTWAVIHGTGGSSGDRDF